MHTMIFFMLLSTMILFMLLTYGLAIALGVGVCNGYGWTSTLTTWAVIFILLTRHDH